MVSRPDLSVPDRSGAPRTPRAHQLCMDYASHEAMVQDFSLPFGAHLDGFPVEAIARQMRRTSRCAFCGRSGACTTCAVSSCNNKKTCEHFFLNDFPRFFFVWHFFMLVGWF